MINEKLIKISAGLTPVQEQDLKLGDEVQILARGQITKTEQKDNQDGTHDLVYTFKGYIVYVNEEKTDEYR